MTSPPWSFGEIYPSAMSRTGRIAADRYGTVTGVTEPLGLLWIGANLRRSGHTPVIQEAYDAVDDTWFESIRRAEPDVVGLTLTAFGGAKAAPYLERLRRLLPHARLVIGGPYPSAVGAAALAEMPGVDFAIRSHGEEPMRALCDALARGEDGTGIPGVVARTSAGVVLGPPNPGVELDSLPFPARDLVDMSRYRPSMGFYNRLPSVSMMTTRGCPVRCKFCISSNSVDYRGVDAVIEELRECVGRYGARHVLFWDEDIAIKKARAVELCEALIRSELGVSWCANLTVWKAADRELLALLRRAGCWKLLFGLESGVGKNLAALDKPLNLAPVRERLEAVSRAGIETFATFMFGIPGETREEADQTVRFACTLPLDYALFLNFVPFPGTPYYPDVERHGRFLGPWSTQAVAFVPHTMTAVDLRELRVRSYRRFYLRPRYILRRLLKIRSVEDIRRNFRGLVATLSMRSSGEIYAA